MSVIFFRGTVAVDQRFAQVAGAFAILSLICNHPHFMISYKFGYGRGWRFIFRNAFCLLLVPLALIGLFTFAYLWFDSDIADFSLSVSLNWIFLQLGLGFRLGRLANVGREIFGVSLWLMYLTVGWHYAKQVFGCMMVVGRFDHYPLSRLSRNLIKLSVFSVAANQFCSFATIFDESLERSVAAAGGASEATMSPLGLPEFLGRLTGMATIGFAVAVVIWVFLRTKMQHGRWPSAGFIIPWMALHVWWLPILHQPEFNLLVVPFFHSAQYLPFAYRVEASGASGSSTRRSLNGALKILVLLGIGFVMFEALPGYLDEHFGPNRASLPWFFVGSFAVFINIHHFFIDAVAWKFRQPEVRRALF